MNPGDYVRALSEGDLTYLKGSSIAPKGTDAGN
jgi:hypothetical protein